MTPQEQFQDALEKYQFATCTRLLTEYPLSIDPTFDNNKAFCMACEGGSKRLVKRLIHDERTNIFDYDWYGPVHALRCGFVKIIKIIAKHLHIDRITLCDQIYTRAPGLWLETQGQDYAIVNVCKNDDPDIARWYMRKIDCTQCPDKLEQAMVIAASRGFHKVFKVLCARQEIIRNPISFYAVLRDLIGSKRPKMVKTLYSYLKSRSLVNNQLACFLLMEACKINDYKCLKFLLNHTNDIMTKKYWQSITDFVYNRHTRTPQRELEMTLLTNADIVKSLTWSMVRRSYLCDHVGSRLKYLRTEAILKTLSIRHTLRVFILKLVVSFNQ